MLLRSETTSFIHWHHLASFGIIWHHLTSFDIIWHCPFHENAILSVSKSQGWSLERPGLAERARNCPGDHAEESASPWRVGTWRPDSRWTQRPHWWLQDDQDVWHYGVAGWTCRNWCIEMAKSKNAQLQIEVSRMHKPGAWNGMEWSDSWRVCKLSSCDMLRHVKTR